MEQGLANCGPQAKSVPPIRADFVQPVTENYFSFLNVQKNQENNNIA